VTVIGALMLLPLIGRAQPSPLSTTSLSRDESLVASLETVLIDVDYRAVDLDEIVTFLRERHGLNVHVAWRALEDAGVRRDERIEVHLKQVSLATLLDTVLADLERGGRSLSYHVRGGVITISTTDDLVENTILRLYDITDLIESGYAIRRFANTPVLSMNVTGREFIGGERRSSGGGFGGGSGFGGGVFGDPGAAGARRMERIDFIVSLVEEQIDPDSWQANGGSIGTIHVVNNTLLIRHTLATHRQIEGFMSVVRRTRSRPLDADAVILRLPSDRAGEWRMKAEGSFPRLRGALVDELMASDDDETVLLRATTSGLNGERIWLSALKQRDVLTSMSPLVGDHSNAFKPATGNTTEGLELIVLPLVHPDGETVTLDVQMAWVPPADVSSRPVVLASGAA
jgi:hypothetical protein